MHRLTESCSYFCLTSPVKGEMYMVRGDRTGRRSSSEMQIVLRFINTDLYQRPRMSPRPLLKVTAAALAILISASTWSCSARTTSIDDPQVRGAAMPVPQDFTARDLDLQRVLLESAAVPAGVDPALYEQL